MGPKKAKGKKGKGEGKKKKTDAQREVSGADLASMEEEQERKTLVVSADAMFHQTTKEEHDLNNQRGFLWGSFFGLGFGLCFWFCIIGSLRRKS